LISLEDRKEKDDEYDSHVDLSLLPFNQHLSDPLSYGRESLWRW